jgi:ubiquinone/menaquinone biosynthesis C-methylase UbiE
MLDLSERSQLPEKMDEPGIAKKEIHQALKELEIINKLLGGYRVILHALDQVEWSDRPLTIMDVGCGGGDMLRAISKWAERKKKKVQLIGIDRNVTMTEFASDRSKTFSNIRFMTCDVFDDALMHEKADIVMNSLFCHHFDNDDLVNLIKRINQLASEAVIINDIDRHWFAYQSIKTITLLFSKTCLVKYDAPLSVARSLKRNEWQAILASAGINNYTLRWMWAWRWQIIAKKN